MRLLIWRECILLPALVFYNVEEWSLISVTFFSYYHLLECHLVPRGILTFFGHPCI